MKIGTELDFLTIIISFLLIDHIFMLEFFFFHEKKENLAKSIDFDSGFFFGTKKK